MVWHYWVISNQRMTSPAGAPTYDTMCPGLPMPRVAEVEEPLNRRNEQNQAIYFLKFFLSLSLMDCTIVQWALSMPFNLIILSPQQVAVV